MTATTGTAPSLAGRGGFRSDVVAALAVTTTVSYGVLYYAFGALLEPMRLDLRISTTTATGALTLASLVSAVLAIPVGRWLDARGGHGVMSAGSVIAAASVLAWSQVHDAYQLYAVFVALGIASAMVLYPPAFAVIVAVTAPERRTTALLGVTLVAGFASSIFIPLTGQLIHALGWRQALVVLASVIAIVTVPLHVLVLRRTDPSGQLLKTAAAPTRVLRDAGFWLLAVAFVLHSSALAVIGVHLVTYLTKLGHSPTTAATLTGLLGLLSVTGRIVTTILRRWLPITSITAVIITLQGIALSLLPAAGDSVIGAAACLIAFGLGFGVASIAKPAILLDRYGDHGYATIAGFLGTPITIAAATAPLAAAALATALGYTPLILTAAAACVLGGLALAATRHLPRSTEA
ncbi:putative MFS family arabinose efflux permease [Kribbella sp. VKM Ac-2527]|uniref:Putative MFS family arabinose efflux permease n=1 Tax=Kribbella caucasensis TaxID=2512215 RepID=A0A4R6K4V2_9ACTN|nr:MFS transporter [Kribbella sp. VKM Ac-2527]TDO44269.1 putative MFS family arabinose efflux permease [Kribbella sp. VKM Ac-2527]